MVTSSAGDLRNFAVVGHASSGKTTLSEAMLACAGVIGRMGNVAQGTTVSDYHVTERQHQISTQTSLLHCAWIGKKMNILDTPGYLDFISEALAAVHVADFALVVVHAQHGIGVGTEWVWQCATDCGIPLEADGHVIRLARLGRPVRLGKELRARGPVRLVLGQARVGDLLQRLEAGAGTAKLGKDQRAVDGHDGRTRQLEKCVVELQDRLPVRRARPTTMDVGRLQRRLELVATHREQLAPA